MPRIKAQKPQDPQPLRSQISEEDAWRCDIAPLGAINGRFPLRNEHIPEYLQQTVSDLSEAANEGKRLIILNCLERARRCENSAPNADIDDDVVQLLECGVKNVAPFEGYNVISSTPDLWRLNERLLDATQTDANEAVLRNSEKSIVLISSQSFGEVRNKYLPPLLNRLQRVYDGAQCILEVPKSPHGSLREQWSNYLLKADVSEFRRLLVSAAAATQQIPHAPAKAMASIPREYDSGFMEHYGPQYIALLKICQSMLWDSQPKHLLIWGENGTGKTTLLMAMAQTMHQLAQGISYTRFAPEQEFERTVVNRTVVSSNECNHPRRPIPFSSFGDSVKTAFIDQIDEFPITRRVCGNENPKRWNGNLIATSNLNLSELCEELTGAHGSEDSLCALLHDSIYRSCMLNFENWVDILSLNPESKESIKQASEATLFTVEFSGKRWGETDEWASLREASFF